MRKRRKVSKVLEIIWGLSVILSVVMAVVICAFLIMAFLGVIYSLWLFANGFYYGAKNTYLKWKATKKNE